MKRWILAASLVFSSLTFAESVLRPGEMVKEAFSGAGIELYVFDDMSARFEFDCGSAQVQAGRWPTGQSRVAAVGIYTPVHGPRPEKATFKANVDVAMGRMTLAMKIGNSPAVNYQLSRDRSPEMKRCH